jgi:hypothetical protein
LIGLRDFKGGECGTSKTRRHWLKGVYRVLAAHTVILSSAALFSGTVAFGQIDSVSQWLAHRQLDLESPAGRAFLPDEASHASFFLIGGLHGDEETQRLVQDIVIGSAKFGYHYVAVEMSPWAAARLDTSRDSTGARLRGSDIEEPRPELLIREVAAINPGNHALDSMVAITRGGDTRTSAYQLLGLLRQVEGFKDTSRGGIPLGTQILKTLEVDSARVDRSQGRLGASNLREQFMKEFFLTHYRAARQTEPTPRFVVNFGQSHLGRGIDQRGVSTLGNFIGELAVAEGLRSFHLLVFAAGGRIFYGGGLQDIDQRKDALAFDLLASLAQFRIALFDLRPIRQVLHNTAAALSPRDLSLLYWADAYDAVICYRAVTPLTAGRIY